MSSTSAVFLLTASLLQWCQVPTLPVVAAKAPVGGRGSRNTKVRIVPRVYGVDHCKDKTHPMVVKNFSSHLHQDGTELYDADFDLTTTAQRLVRAKLIIHRCPLGGAGGECEYFNTWSWNMPVCALTSAKGMPWTPVAENIHPTFVCPLLKGSYGGRNMTVDVNAIVRLMGAFEFVKYSWPVEAQLFSENGLYICFIATLEYRRIRVKEN